MKPVKRTILFEGNVQGVGFRATTLSLARDLEVAGTVQNLPDGRVQLIVEGPAPEIETLLERLHEQFEGFLRTVLEHAAPATGAFVPGIQIVH